MDKILSVANYKVKKSFEELRRKILVIPEIKEKIENNSITYIRNDDIFCAVRIKKGLLEIDFLSDRTFVDPMEFSWKIRSKNFDRRMQLKNIAQIDTVFELLFQYRCIADNK